MLLTLLVIDVIAVPLYVIPVTVTFSVYAHTRSIVLEPDTVWLHVAEAWDVKLEVLEESLAIAAKALYGITKNSTPSNSGMILFILPLYLQRKRPQEGPNPYNLGIGLYVYHRTTKQGIGISSCEPKETEDCQGLNSSRHRDNCRASYHCSDTSVEILQGSHEYASLA